jgi:hypothetical protein
MYQIDQILLSHFHEEKEKLEVDDKSFSGISSSSSVLNTTYGGNPSTSEVSKIPEKVILFS